MSLENNKTDFEKALSEMKDVIELLDHCVDDGIMETLKGVVNEYETHYQSDIEELIDHCNAMEENQATEQTVSGHVEPVVSCDELEVICNTVVELAKIRQKGCEHLCVENFAQQCLGQLLTELTLSKEGKLRMFDNAMKSN